MLISGQRNGGFMNTYIDYQKRINKIQDEMKKSDLDLFVGTRWTASG